MGDYNMLDKAKKYLIKTGLKNAQRAINKAYEKQGLNDRILKDQADINQLRHKHNISDETKRIYKNYVQ